MRRLRSWIRTVRRPARRSPPVCGWSSATESSASAHPVAPSPSLVRGRVLYSSAPAQRARSHANAGPSSMAELIVERGPRAGTHVALSREQTCTIGSDPSCSLALDSPGIGQQHVVVKALKDAGFGLKALNGTVT